MEEVLDTKWRTSPRKATETGVFQKGLITAILRLHPPLGEGVVQAEMVEDAGDDRVDHVEEGLRAVIKGCLLYTSRCV